MDVLQKKKRIQWIDAAKFVGIFMVAFGHNWLDSKFTFLFTAFHMPLFFILAGLTLSTKRKFRQFTIAKAKSLLIPYAFFAVMIIGYYWLMSVTHGGDYDAFEQAKLFLFQRRHTLLWFLVVLFLGELLSYIILKISTLMSGGGYVILFSLALLFILNYILTVTNVNNLIWNADLVPAAAAFILIGVLFMRYRGKLIIEKNNFYIIGVFILAIIVNVTNYQYYSYVDMYSNLYGFYPLFLLGAILSTYFLFLVLQRITLPSWLIFIGTYSLVYYGLHRIIIEWAFIFYGKFGINYLVDQWSGVCLAVINVVMAFLFLTPLTWFLNKKAPWLLGKF